MGASSASALAWRSSACPRSANTNLTRADLETAHEIVLTNGARGAFPVGEFEGKPVAARGPLLAALDDAFGD